MADGVLRLVTLDLPGRLPEDAGYFTIASVDGFPGFSEPTRPDTPNPDYTYTTYLIAEGRLVPRRRRPDP